MTIYYSIGELRKISIDITDRTLPIIIRRFGETNKISNNALEIPVSSTTP